MLCAMRDTNSSRTSYQIQSNLTVAMLNIEGESSMTASLFRAEFNTAV